jgi:predicted signal transduction protein with EAL and GGDEF domain
VAPPADAAAPSWGDPEATGNDGGRRSSETSDRVGRDALVVAAVVATLALACLLWTPDRQLLDTLANWWHGLLIRIVAFLALSHVVMFGFGARRGQDLRRELLERQTAQARLAHLASHDGLTGAANRSSFLTDLQEAAVIDRPLVIALVDLDRFKYVNDTFGHRTGDALLQAVAERMRQCLPHGAVLARLGGDEFTMLFPVTDAPKSICDGSAHTAGPPGPDRTPLGDIPAPLTELSRAVREPFHVDGLVLEIDASIGYVLRREGVVDAETLVHRADIAMYAARADRVQILQYSERLDARERDQQGLHAELSRGIAAGQLYVVFQPKVLMATGDGVGVEALVRWQHPRRGSLTPDAFLPVAEHSGLMRSLTDTVLQQALSACRGWKDQGIALPVAVNLSARSLLDTGLPARIEELLARHGLQPSWLELEVTETTAMTNPTQAVRILAELAALGVGLAIDDYGTGHSSLAYLSRLPVHTLKIDKSFVLRLTTEAADRAIVRSTIELAHNLGLRVVAEGVEDATTWRSLRTWGCDEAQGYWMSRPVPVHEVPQVLTQLPVTVATAPETPVPDAGLSPPR